LQVWGFAASAVLLVLFTVLRAKLAALPLLAFAVYGLFNVTQTGPGLVSGAGILGVELAPTRIRSVSQGITVAGGRIGAAISGFAFPLLFAGIGERGAFLILAGLALLGAILTHLLIPETSQVSLEDLTDDRPALQTG
jgi:MFS family permease